MYFQTHATQCTGERNTAKIRNQGLIIDASSPGISHRLQMAPVISDPIERDFQAYLDQVL